MIPETPATNARDAGAPHARGAQALGGLSLAALGVVYGDIGTSPLYAMKACLARPHGVDATPANVLGLVSLFFWSLVLVVLVKYLVFVMRADNRGEGGILALVALLDPSRERRASRKLGAYVALGLVGAALLYGEAVITPVVSVLGAVEGLGVDSAVFSVPVIQGIAIGVLVALFLLQKRGTARIGALFGPAMVVWFGTLAVLGVAWIARRPDVLVAVDPRHAIRFFARHGAHAFVVLGAVALCVTGAEALYTNLGHFGKRPIRAAWLFAAFPALLLNYFGQGALLLHANGAGSIAAVENPFYAMVAGWARYPLVAIATLAAIIASQALISGAFSLTRAAMQLGYWPRLAIHHTSDSAEGQIYVPAVNAAFLVACIVLVLAFGESTRLAPAYGIAVTGTMSITSVLFYGVARRWGWSRVTAGGLAAAFLAVDLAFLGASVHKLREGGWVPIVLGAILLTLMTTWRAGRLRLRERLKKAALPLEIFLDLGQKSPHRVRGTLRIAGTAVFLTSNPDGAPPSLLHYLKHHMVLHEKVVLLCIQTRRVPEIPAALRVERAVNLGLEVYQVVAAYGFMQIPNVLEIMEACRARGLPIDTGAASFFLGRETLVVTGTPGMARWRKILFAFMSRSAGPANAFFHIPANRVVELGTRIEI